MRNLKKLFSVFLVFAMSLLSVPAIADNTQQTGVKVHYINVGQADSTLIQVDGKNILIDAGNDDNLTYNYLKQQGITKLDYVIATHPHADHIGGMSTIINNFTVDKFYAPKVTTTTVTFENMIKALQNKGLKITTPTIGETIAIGNATLTFLAPNSATYEDLNNYSIVCKLKNGNNSFIFTGDAESLSEGEILAKQLDISANVLKVGHHGSSSSTSQGFLNKVNPQYAIISVGAGNDYGHPNQETLTKLNSKGVKTFRTDTQGTIIATSNGQNITFNTNPAAINTTTTVTTTNTGNNNKANTSVTVTNNKSQTVYRAGANGKVYHYSSECSNMKNPISLSIEEAKQQNLKPCSKCAV